jgi:hypothetical protein
MGLLCLAGLRIVVRKPKVSRSNDWFFLSPFSAELWLTLLATGEQSPLSRHVCPCPSPFLVSEEISALDLSFLLT